MIQNEFEALLRHIRFFLKTEIFSQFSKKKIRLYTLRFLIAFARPHENAIVTDNNTTLWVHAHIMVSVRDVIFLKSLVFNHLIGSFSTTTATAMRTAKKIGLY